MRCPYCNSMNADKASFCVNCGRDLAAVAAPTHMSQPQNQQSPFLPKPPARKEPLQAQYPAPPITQPQRFNAQPKTAPVQQPARRPISPSAQPVQSQAKPQPPATFPPRNVEQLRELEKEAVTYSVADEITVAGRKKTVRIVYPACQPWQQVGTLMKAFDDQKLGNSFELVIVQGSMNKEESLYEYTNGQLQFDRGARLGSQTLNRFQIQTSNGFESESIRILLEEK